MTFISPRVSFCRSFSSESSTADNRPRYSFTFTSALVMMRHLDDVDVRFGSQEIAT